MDDIHDNSPTTATRKSREIEVIEDGSFSFDGYQVVRGEFFSHIYEPSFTFNNNKVSVNTACVKRMPTVEYIQVLVNPEEKKLAVKPCREDEKDSIKWCTNGKKKAPRQVTCRIFFAKVFELMNWNPDYRYKLLGKLIHSNNDYLFVFDLTTPEIYVKTQKDGEKPKTSRIPSYPSGWKTQFGVPVHEHQNNLQVSIFDGIAVFGVQDKPRQRTIPNKPLESEENNYDRSILSPTHSLH